MKVKLRKGDREEVRMGESKKGWRKTGEMTKMKTSNGSVWMET